MAIEPLSRSAIEQPEREEKLHASSRACTHSTTLNGLATLASYFPGASAFLGVLCPACEEQVAGSAFLSRLNAGGDTVPGVSYTVIESANDEVVTPYTSAFLSGPNVTNVLLQS